MRRAHHPPARTLGALEFFERTAADYALSHDRLDMVERSRTFARWIKNAWAQDRAPGTCLDLGCGTGLVSLAAAQFGFRVVGIDGSRLMLAAAAANARAAGVELRLQLATIPLADDLLAAYAGTVDLVIASSLIEFIHDADGLIGQCRTLLAPGGMALVSFANKASLLRATERPWRRFYQLRAQAHAPASSAVARQHLHKEQEARDLFHRAGLEVDGVEYFALPHWAYSMWRSPKRPSRLATLFLLAGRAPTTSAD